MTPPVNLSQSIRGSSASSGQPIEFQPSNTPPDVVTPRKRRRVNDEDDDVQAQLDQIREDRMKDRARSLAMYAETNRRMDELHNILINSTASTQTSHEAIMNHLRGIHPLASMLPGPSGVPLMIQGQPSGSIHSGESSLADPAHVPIHPAAPVPTPAPSIPATMTCQPTPVTSFSTPVNLLPAHAVPTPSPSFHESPAPSTATTPGSVVQVVLAPPPLPSSETCPETPPPPSDSECKAVDGLLDDNQPGAANAATGVVIESDIVVSGQSVVRCAPSPAANAPTGCSD